MQMKMINISIVFIKKQPVVNPRIYSIMGFIVSLCVAFDQYLLNIRQTPQYQADALISGRRLLSTKTSKSPFARKLRARFLLLLKCTYWIPLFSKLVNSWSIIFIICPSPAFIYSDADCLNLIIPVFFCPDWSWLSERNIPCSKSLCRLPQLFYHLPSFHNYISCFVCSLVDYKHI